MTLRLPKPTSVPPPDAPSTSSLGDPETHPVTVLRGIGPERACLLHRLGITTLGDLLRHAPRRHEDRSRFRTLAEIAADPDARSNPQTLRLIVLASGVKRMGHQGKTLSEVIFTEADSTRRLHARWWNLPHLARQFSPGQPWILHGKLSSVRPLTVDHPETELVEPDAPESIHMGRLVPIHPLTEGLSQRALRTWIHNALEYVHPHPAPAQDLLRPLCPPLPDLGTAFWQLHFPETTALASAAHQRLALDEAISLQSELARRRQRLQQRSAPRMTDPEATLIRPFLRNLGFKLTPDQAAVLRDIRSDLQGPIPMRRLLQGDVGCGKTVVLACAGLMAIEAGFSAVLMAPTSILAMQHARTFRQWLEPIGVPVLLHTAAERGLDAGDVTRPDPKHPFLAIGTHALLEDPVTLPNLGLVMIDEQHRFGVTQRNLLTRKGGCPHVLVTTATPIPRTLGLTLYGDLEASVIRHSPPGRGVVRTFLRTRPDLPRIHAFLATELQKGRQAYVVVPVIEDAARLELTSIRREQDALIQALPGARIEVLHGRLPETEKHEVMQRFQDQVTQVLVATPVIEVGMDVPNATLMLIHNAERFGLAQIHQLRGRIGRGGNDGTCILLVGRNGTGARERLQALAETHDGFKVAELDLKARGPGDPLGLEQSGLPNFRFLDLLTSLDLLEIARDLVNQSAGP